LSRQVKQKRDEFPFGVCMRTDLVIFLVPHETQVECDVVRGGVGFEVGTDLGAEHGAYVEQEFAGLHESEKGVVGWVGELSSVVFGAIF
jgi:hypothetical protein